MNGLEFRVLKCGIEFEDNDFRKLGVNGGGYYLPDSEEASKAIEFMKDGLLKNNPVENWSHNGWDLTKKGKSLLKKAIKDIRKHHGHVWVKEDGRVDFFAMSEGYHNGYKCANCGFEFCVHCTSEFEIEVCSQKK